MCNKGKFWPILCQKIDGLNWARTPVPSPADRLSRRDEIQDLRHGVIGEADPVLA